MTSLNGGCDIQYYSIVTINRKVYFLAFISLPFFFLRLGLYLSPAILEIIVLTKLSSSLEIEPTEMCASAS